MRCENSLLLFSPWCWVEETFLCIAGQAVSSRFRVLPVSLLPRSEGTNVSFGFAPREFQGGLLGAASLSAVNPAFQDNWSSDED
ncbi:hypothetical protein CHARACLAT_020484 [Characodon lateralis]|uniref:Uncharacterized protein n=1 Tax=Characodon lateralis TaxID=208331 RepID=A0ABU7EMH8_9TELE|nr:hypothetical protein [Characodon lateralis]